MSTNTTRLGLIKPDFVDVVDISELNSNAYDIDAAVGPADVTSRTRPAVPWNGQIIHETDTDTTLVWDGTAWVETGTAVEDLDDLGDVDITTPTAGQKLVFDGTNWVNLEGYVYVDTVYFTSNSTFTKATYPWLRAIRVKCVGGGGAGSIRSFNGQSGSGGPGGGYAESFITDISGLDASVTITRGAGGAAVTRSSAGETVGNAGSNSSFGTLVIGNGGSPSSTLVSAAGGSGTGDFVFPGGTGGGGAGTASSNGGTGGNSKLGHGGAGGYVSTTNQNGLVGTVYGGGGGGARVAADGSTVSSGAGANGIVIVDLYA